MGTVHEGQYILNLRHHGNWVRESDQPTRVCDHLHFQIDPSVRNTTPETNPLSVLPKPPHNVSVVIEQFRYVRRSGDTGPVSYLSETSRVVANATMLRSDIVIIASGEDDMGYNAPGHEWTPGAHKLEYKVKDGPRPTAKIDTMKLFEWNGRLPSTRHYRVIYNMGPRPCRSTYHFNYYVATNTDNNDPINNDDFDQYWKTNAREAGAARNGVGADDAGINSQAFFPDGKYTIEVTGYDIEGGSGSDERRVILDNFKPYVKRVTVKVGDAVKYDASWPEIAAGTLEALRRDVDELCPRGTLSFEIFFSETMDAEWTDFMVELQPSGSSDWINVSNNTSWDRDTFDNDKWTGRVTLPADAGEGEARIRIRARDLAGNELDTDPQNIAVFDRLSGSWSNYSSGRDENHRIKIEASKGSFTAKIATKSESKVA